jgi:hypothetical protein
MLAAMDSEAILGGVLMAGLGLLFTLGSCWWIAVLLRMRGRASGTIVATETGPDCETLPVVAFTPLQGPATRFVGAAPIGPGIGETVAVRYDVADPGQARIATLRGSFLGPAIGLLAGFLLLGLFAVAARDQRAGDAVRADTPAERRAAYLPLQLWATELGGCTGGACTAREVARLVRAYDRATAAAAGASPAVGAQIDALERRLAVVRRGGRIGPSLREPLVALVGQLLGELSADGCRSACVSRYGDRR